jgi:hypothetical protein
MKNVLNAIIWVPIPLGILIWYVTNNGSALSIIVFVDAVIYLIVETYKMKFYKKEIDTSQGLPKILFGDNSILKQSGVFFEESIYTAKGWKKFQVWFMFLFSIVYIIFFVVYFLV